MVRVPPRLHRIEGARKKFFAKESVAKAYVERLTKQLGDYHSQALGLSDRQKLEASECYRLLEKYDASLLMRHQTRRMSRFRRNSSSAASGICQERWMRNAVTRREKYSFRTVF
jgi:hypothetical protein